MAENSLKISIILPFYNAEKTLLRAIKSISVQSFTNFKCILINNNSRDKSSLEAFNFTKVDPRFSYDEEPLQGVVYAPNHGTSIARCEYICRMDADDELTENRLIHYQDLPKPGKSFILIYNRHLKQKKEIKEYLNSKEYLEGKDYLFCA